MELLLRLAKTRSDRTYSISRTARDVGEQLTFLPVGSLPTHEMEDLTMEDYETEMNKIEIPCNLYDNPHGPDWLPPSNLVPDKAFAHMKAPGNFKKKFSVGSLMV